MLLPALSKAKSKAQMIQCSSNMKNWGYATVMYLGDFNDRLPYFGYSSADYSQPFWHALLAPYVAKLSQPGVQFNETAIFTNDLRKCPGGSYSLPAFARGTWDPKTWNCWIGANFGPYGMPPLSGPFYYANGGMAPLNVSRIKKAADALMFMDTVTHYSIPRWSRVTSSAWTWMGMARRTPWRRPNIPFNFGRPTVHNGGANLTLLDGHVERMPYKKLWQIDAAGNVVNSVWYMED